MLRMSRTKRVSSHNGDDEAEQLLSVVVDYKPTPFGTWVGVVEVPGYQARRVQSSDAHQALRAALDHVEVIADETGRSLATVHRLNGDAAAWAQRRGQRLCPLRLGRGARDRLPGRAIT